MRALAGAIAAAVALAVPTSAAADNPPPSFGYNDNTVVFSGATGTALANLADAVAAKARAGGATVYRTTVSWDGYAAKRDVYKLLAEKLEDHGVRPLWIVIDAPETELSIPDRISYGICKSNPQSACHYAPDDTTTGQDHWRTFVADVASLDPDAAGIEVWNEPNTKAFWMSGPAPQTPTVDAARYTRLLTAAYAGVRSKSPTMPVITGGVVDVGSGSGNTFAEEFVRQIYANGGAGSFTAVGAHPYVGYRGPPDVNGPGPGGISEYLDQLRRLRLNIPNGAHLWITEFGYYLGDVIDEATQARYLTCAYDLTLSSTVMPADVDGILVHTLIKLPGDQHDFGLLDPGPVGQWREKQAFGALANAVATPMSVTSCPQP